MNFNKKLKLVGKKYIALNSTFGEYNDGFKNGRPTYILKSVNNDYLFLIISTQTKHQGQKNSYQDVKYIEWEPKSYLRLDLKNGWNVVKKSDIDIDKLKDIYLSEEDKKELLKFYDQKINEEKERLNDIKNNL